MLRGWVGSWCVTVCCGAAALLAGTVPGLAQTTRPTTGSYGGPEAVCTLKDDRIVEASGIAASRRTPGLYYVHNDSGDRPRVFLVDRTGRTRLTIRLKNARHVDWEDIALAPSDKGGKFDVCVADIGDNGARREELIIYRFPEVDPAAADGAVLAVQAVAYRIAYADGPADAEAFVVHPQTGDGYVLTKRLDGACHVYKLAAPWNPKERTVLPKVATLRFPKVMPLQTMVTAADISPDGRRLATRSYLCGWEWRLPATTDKSDFERIFGAEPTRLELAVEPQGEALCYAADGRALLTVSETPPAVLYETRATAPPERHAP
ncbi:MAG TPA: hypothetical protein VM487_07635 [Phycisphaerae bacterium]|nr:hypothetical protein [Phycisphaerae bacterium]